MKNFTIFLLLLICFASCKKAIESAKEDLVIKAMTEGQWRVTKFTKNTTDMTVNFSPYKFQFKTNNTVDAINNVTTESTGSWSADAVTRTIISSFANANATVSLLNGTWLITNNSWTFVEATQTVNSDILTLRIDK